MFHAGTVKPPIFMGMFQPLHKHLLNQVVGEACERPLPPVAARCCPGACDSTQLHPSVPSSGCKSLPAGIPIPRYETIPQVCHGLRNEIT